MLKDAETGYVDLDQTQPNPIKHDFPALLFVLCTLFCTALAHKFEIVSLLAAPVILWFVGIPIMDKISGQRYLATKDMNGERDKFSSEVLVAVSLSTIALTVLALSNALSLTGLALMGIANGLLVLIALHYSHQYREQAANLLLKAVAASIRGMCFAPQFNGTARHMRQLNAATSNDAASARMGESYFHFMKRYMSDVFRRSRRSTVTRSALTRRNAHELIRSAIVFAAYVLLLLKLGGSPMLMFIIAQSVFVAWQLSAFDYVERYGQRRKCDESGALEPLGIQHQWGSAANVTNALLNFRTLGVSGGNHVRRPKYDYGFGLLSLLILFPWLWFRYANPLLAAHVDYNLEKVNLDGDAYEDLMIAYHRAD